LIKKNLWDRCYNLKKYFGRKKCEEMGLLTQNTAGLGENWIITVFLRKTPIFCPNRAQIADNCNHHIDPWNTIFMPLAKNAHSKS
jgi:hypothetical protein